MAQVIVKHHAFKSINQPAVEIQYGLTLREIVDGAMLPSHVQPYLALFINGVFVEPQYWDKIRPKERAHVLITLIPQGGEGANKGLRLGLLLALSIVAGPLAGALVVGASTATIGAVSLGITMVGSMAINALFPPPIDKNRNSAATDRSASLSITGQSNQATPYGTVPRLYGQHKVFPRLAAKPYTLLEGDDVFFYAIYDFGYGPLQVEDLAIGETALSLYNDTQINLHTTLTDGSELTLVTSTVNQQNQNVKLDFNIPFTLTTSNITDAMMIDINFPQGLMFISSNTGDRASTSVDLTLEYRATGSPNYLPFQNLRFNFNNNDGVILNDSLVLTLADGTVNPTWQNKTLSWTGYKAGSMFIDVEHGFFIADIIDGSWVRLSGQLYTIANTQSIGGGLVRLNLTTPLVSDFPNGYIDWGTFRKIAIRVTVHTVSDNTFKVERNTLIPFSLSLFMFMPARGQWDIRLVRSTPKVNNGNTFLDDVYLRTTREITYDSPINYPVPHTVLEVKIRASNQLNGTIDQLNAICTSILPVYDPNTLIWTDTPTRNPAWVFADVLRGVANPKPLADNRLDLISIADFATWCDRIAPNVSEPYYQCDVVVDYNTTALELAQNVAGTGRGSLMIRNGLYSIAVDGKDLTPIQQFTPNNSSNFTGNRTFLDTPHALRVNFIDPESNYQQAEVFVYADGYGQNNATKFETLGLFGCTRVGQAWRDGRYFLAQGIKRQEDFTLTVDIENLVCERGDVVRVQHDVPMVGGTASRVRSTNAPIDGDSADVITLVEPVIVDLVSTNAIDIRTLDGVLVRGNIIAQPDQFSVQISPAITGIFANDPAVIGFFNSGQAPTYDYLVKRIEPGDDLNASITLTPLEADIYLADQGPIGPYTPIFTPQAISGAIPQTPVNLLVNQQIQFIDRFPYLSVVLQWDNLDAAQFSFYEIHVLDEGQWRLATTARNETRFTFIDNVNLIQRKDLVGQTFSFKVLAVNELGNKTPWNSANTITHTITGDTTKPGDVEYFDVSMLTQDMRLTWGKPLDTFDLADYILRYTPDITAAANWTNSSILAIAPWNSDSLKVEARVGTYLIRARDTSGNTSLNAVRIKTTIPSLVGLNIILTIEEAPDWLGVKTRTEVVQQQLRLVKLGVNTWALNGDYIYNTVVNLGASYVSRVFSEIKGYAFTSDAIMETWQPLAIADPIGGKLQEDEYTLTVQISTKDSGTLVNEWVTMASVPVLNTGESLSSPWRNVVAGDYTFQIARFRLLLKSTRQDLAVVCTSSRVRVDMPDRILSGDDVLSPIGGLRVDYDPPFFVKPSLVFAEQSNILGQTRLVEQHTRTGFVVKFKDAIGDDIAGSFDWMAQGYGQLTSGSI